MTNQQILQTLSGIHAELYYRIDRDGLKGVSEEATQAVLDHLTEAVKLWHEATGEELK